MMGETPCGIGGEQGEAIAVSSLDIQHSLNGTILTLCPLAPLSKPSSLYLYYPVAF